MKRPDPGTIALVLVAALGAAGLALTSPHPDVDAPTSAPHATSTTAPDWTVAPCNWWAADSTPDLPPYTLPNICVTPTGALSTPTNP